MHTKEPKLLLADDLRILRGLACTPEAADALEELFRERGLIAPEPVDALLIEAREIVAQFNPLIRQSIDEGKYDCGDFVGAVIAALKRGMELAQPPLTREMVREAVIRANPQDIETCDFLEDAGSLCRDDAENFVTRLHTRLTERQP